MRGFAMALVMAAAAASAPAVAQEVPRRVTAQQLGAVCSQDREACLTYVLGAVDGMIAVTALSGRPPIFCIPSGTPNQELADAAVRYLRANPQEGRTNAAVVVVAGLRQIYPCPRS